MLYYEFKSIFSWKIISALHNTEFFLMGLKARFEYLLVILKFCEFRTPDRVMDTCVKHIFFNVK